MKKSYIYAAVAALILVVLGYFMFVQPVLNNRTISTTVDQTIVAQGLDLQFSYPSGEQGYTLIEPPAGETSNFEKAYILMSTPEYIELQNSTAGREAPPSVSIFVFPLPEDTATTDRVGRITRIQNWAIENQNITSFNLAEDTPEIVEIDGVKALRYTADGLYKQDVYLTSYQGYIYMFVGQYRSENDAIRDMFAGLVDSVSF